MPESSVPRSAMGCIAKVTLLFMLCIVRVLRGWSSLSMAMGWLEIVMSGTDGGVICALVNCVNA